MTVNENEQCSAAIVLIVVTLDSFVNRIVYFSGAQKLPKTNLPLVSKLMKGLLKHRKRLLNRVTDVVACRDSIVHAYIWEGIANTRGRQSHFRLSAVTEAQGKIQTVLKGTRSRHIRLNLVPINVGVNDVVKALIVSLRLMRTLGNRPGAIEGLIPPEAAIALQKGGARGDRFEDWIGYLLRVLRPGHCQEIVKLFRLTPVRVNGDVIFYGITPSK